MKRKKKKEKNCLLGRIQKKKEKKIQKKSKKKKKNAKRETRSFEIPPLKKRRSSAHTHTHTHKRCARRSVVVVVVHEKQNAMMSRHYYRHARISPPLFFFFFLATCVAFVAFAIDRSNAIRVPDFTTGIKSKFSVMNESVKMMNPKNRRAKELEEREALMKDAYGDDKIVGWDAVNNKPIYDENWSSNKALLEKYNPGSTAREDLPKYKHLADREEEQNWLYRNRYVDNCLSCT